MTPKAAADEYWDGTVVVGSGVPNGAGGSGTWNNLPANTNWVDANGLNPHVYDPNQLAIFSTLGGTVTLGDNISFSSLRFDVNGYTINPGAGPFSMTPIGTAPITAQSGANVIINPQLTGAGGIAVQGQGTVTLTSGTSNYTGGTTLATSGTLFVDSNNAIGTGTLSITGVGTTLSTHVNGITLANPVSILTNSFQIGTAGPVNDFTLNGNINLNGSTRTIVGITNQGQVHFGTGGIGTAGETAGLNLNTIFTADGDYVAFITDSAYQAHYTGLTTINNGAFLVFEGMTANTGIIGDVDVEGNGVIDYLGGNSAQIADKSNVLVNSVGNTAAGQYFAGFDLFQSTAETIGTLSGTGVVALDAATLTLGGGTFDGTIFDGTHGLVGGSLVKIGNGTFVLGGTNFYTGTTTVNGGSFFLFGSITSLVTVNKDARFVLGTSGTITTAPGSTPMTVNAGGTFLNAGNLTATGPGSRGAHISGPNGVVTNLTGATISGDTGVYVDNSTGIATVNNAGTITGTGGTAVDATNSAGVTVGDFGTFTGAVKLGTGINTVVLATRTKHTAISALTGTHDTLQLAGGSEDTLNLTGFAGYESLSKIGGGTWTIDGTVVFPGGTTIDAGILNVNGTLVSNTVIHPVGTLSGTGTIAGNLTNFGTVMPGTPLTVMAFSATPGTLTVKGNYTQHSTGTLFIQVNGAGAGQYSRLAINGHAQLDGRLVLNQGGEVNLRLGQQITFLTADGGVSGQFSNVINPFATGTIIVGKLVYEQNAVVLEGAQGSFQSIENQLNLTPNQRAVARMLDSAIGDKKATKLIEYLDGRPIERLPNDFNQIAPEEMTSVFRIGVSLADVQARNVQRRTADLRAGARGFSASGFETTGGANYTGGLAGPNGNTAENTDTPAPERRWGTFIKGVGDFVHVGDSQNASGYDLNTGGVTVGADYQLTPGLAVGLTTGYTGTNANLTNDGRLLVNGGKVGVYGTYYTGGYYADAAVTGGMNNYSTRRSSLLGDASGSTEGKELEVLADTGYDWRLDALTIGPTAEFQYTYVGIDGYSEHGSLTPLRYAGQHQASIHSTFGIRMAYEWKLGNVIVRPEAQIAWQHEYGARSYSIDSALASGAGSLFSVSDTPIGRDSLLFGAGVAVLWNPRTSTYLYYDADLLKKEYNSQSVSGGLRMNF